MFRFYPGIPQCSLPAPSVYEPVPAFMSGTVACSCEDAAINEFRVWFLACLFGFHKIFENIFILLYHKGFVSIAPTIIV